MSRRPWLLLFALAALNLRGPITVFGPLLGTIMSSLSIGEATASLLTTGMLFCFGLMSPLAPAVAGRLGLDRAIAFALALIAIGGVMRGVADVTVMLLGTLCAGMGTAFGNVYMPSLVKRDRDATLGRTMGLYGVMMGGGAAFSAATALPLMRWSGNWSVPVWLWAVFAAASALAWWSVARRCPEDREPAAQPPLNRLLRSPVAWMATLFMGAQSLSFYTLQTWITSVAADAGVPATQASAMLSLINLVAIPSAYLVAWQAPRVRHHSRSILALCLPIAMAVAGLIWAPAVAPGLWATLLGIGQGGCFSIALSMIVLRTDHPGHAAMLSGMAQSVGYLLGATGPLLFGLLHGVTGDWRLPLGFLSLVVVAQAWTGALVGRPRMVRLPMDAAINNTSQRGSS
jgi:CP family cyanate transporter-like MFS transporter